MKVLGGKRSDPLLVVIHRKRLAGVHDLNARQSGFLPLGQGGWVRLVENHAIKLAGGDAFDLGIPC
jgi:hypothetical protein